MTFNLFMELGATDEQLDFPILYGSARSGYAIYNMGDEGKDLTPLFETIIKNTKPFEGNEMIHYKCKLVNLLMMII